MGVALASTSSELSGLYSASGRMAPRPDRYERRPPHPEKEEEEEDKKKTKAKKERGEEKK